MWRPFWLHFELLTISPLPLSRKSLNALRNKPSHSAGRARIRQRLKRVDGGALRVAELPGAALDLRDVGRAGSAATAATAAAAAAASAATAASRRASSGRGGRIGRGEARRREREARVSRVMGRRAAGRGERHEARRRDQRARCKQRGRHVRPKRLRGCS